MASPWSNASRTIYLPFTPIHASASLPMLVFFLHMRLWTFTLCAIVMNTMSELHLKQLSPLWSYFCAMSS